MRKLANLGIILLAMLLLVGCSNLRKEQAPTTKESAENEKTSTTTTYPEVTATEPTVPTESVAPVSYREIAVVAGYGDVYDEICRLMESGHVHKEYKYINDALLEIADYNYSPKDRFDRIAFDLKELNHDRSMEMVVVDTGDNKKLLAVYTYIDGEIVCVRGTGGKVSTYWLTDSRFYYEGVAGVCPFFETDYESWRVGYPDSENSGAKYYYENDYGNDTEVQEITEEEYRAKQKEFNTMIFTFTPYPFC